MANFTEKEIKSTFMELLNKKPLNQITVKEISALCGINRNSFYYHFNDIPALLETILTEEAERLSDTSAESESIYARLIEAIDFAIENKTAIFHIYNSANREMFESYLDRISTRTVADFIDNATQSLGIVERDRDALVLYYKCLLVGFVIDWLATGMKYDLRDKITDIWRLYDGAMATAIERCERE